VRTRSARGMLYDESAYVFIVTVRPSFDSWIILHSLIYYYWLWHGLIQCNRVSSQMWLVCILLCSFTSRKWAQFNRKDWASGSYFVFKEWMSFGLATGNLLSRYESGSRMSFIIRLRLFNLFTRLLPKCVLTTPLCATLNLLCANSIVSTLIGV